MASALAPHGAQVGDFALTLVRNSVYWWDGGAMFGVVPKTLWSRKTPADELNRVPLAFNCYLIQTGDHTILIETGGGDKMDPRERERAKLPPVPDPLPEVLPPQFLRIITKMRITRSAKLLVASTRPGAWWSVATPRN